MHFLKKYYFFLNSFYCFFYSIFYTIIRNQKKIEEVLDLGTRGAYGFYKNGENKLTYNHYDSYPEGLGEDVVSFIRATPLVELHKMFDEIEMVDRDSKPTAEQIESYKHFADTRVSSGDLEDWYVLLRKTQGDLFAFQKGLRHMIEGGEEFMKDSLYCEWGYVINLDENILEIYKGFQNAPQDNRYHVAEPCRMGYYNVTLVKSYPLSSIPKNWMQEVDPIIEDEDEDDYQDDVSSQNPSTSHDSSTTQNADYQQIIESLGGAVIQISKEDTTFINPLAFTKDVEEGFEEDTSEKKEE